MYQDALSKVQSKSTQSSQQQATYSRHMSHPPQYKMDRQTKKKLKSWNMDEEPLTMTNWNIDTMCESVSTGNKYSIFNNK